MNVETLHGVYAHMECQSTWSVETLCYIHMDMDTECIISHMETLHNIHMDTNMDMDTECIISHMETLCNIHMDTNMDMDMGCIISHMETLHRVTSIWSVNLHGLWRHSTFCNIHMDTNMDMDMECNINHMECGKILQSMISIQNLLTDKR